MQCDDVFRETTVLATVDTNGNVIDAVIYKGSGATAFDDAAKQAVMTWKYSPVLEDGIPVSRKTRIPNLFAPPRHRSKFCGTTTPPKSTVLPVPKEGV